MSLASSNPFVSEHASGEFVTSDGCVVCLGRRRVRLRDIVLRLFYAS